MENPSQREIFPHNSSSSLSRQTLQNHAKKLSTLFRVPTRRGEVFQSTNKRRSKKTSKNHIDCEISRNKQNWQQSSPCELKSCQTQQKFSQIIAIPSTIQQISTETITTSVTLNRLIDDLTSTASSLSITKEESGSFILNIFNKIKNSNSVEVTLKFCQFVIVFARQQQIIFEGSQFDELVSFLLNYIKCGINTMNQLLLLSALRALSFVIFENGTKCVSKIPDLLDILIPLADHKRNLDKSTQRLAINCLGNLCAKGGATLSPYYKTIFDILYVSYSQTLQEVQSDGRNCKLFSSLLRAIQFILLEAKFLHESHTTSLLSTMRKFIFYGTKYHPFPCLPINQKTTLINSKLETNEIDNETASPNKTLNSIDHVSQKSKTNVNSELPIQTRTTTVEFSSDSEQSDYESLPDRLQFWKVRLHALFVIRALVQCLGSARFVQYWTQFLPSSQSKEPTLCTVLLHDPAYQVRSAAAQILQEIFRSSAKFLIAAVDPTRPTGTKSYTPLSYTLGAIVKECHFCLIKALQTETRQVTLIQIIKALSVLVQNSPYEKLNAGLLTLVTTQLHELIFGNYDVAVQVAALECLTFVMSTKSPFVEIETILDATPQQIQLLSTSNFFNDSQFQTSSVASAKPWNLFVQLLRLLSKYKQNIIRTETLKVLAAIATTYFPLFSRHWSLVFPEILSAIDCPDMSCRLAASNLLESIMKTAAQIETSDSHLEKWWNEILNSASVIDLFHDPSYTVRASTCSCFSYIPMRVFESFKRDKRIMIETWMLALTRDEVAIVRAAATKALGCFISFPSLKQDALFVSDVALALTNGLRDKNLNVRIRSSWAIGNLCDALISVKERNEQFTVIDDIPKEILLNLVKCVLDAAKDNDKVRSNAVRALGNFLRFVPSTTLLENESLLRSIIDTLIFNLSEGSVKVQWNACYAISNAFHNPALQTVKVSHQTALVNSKEKTNDNEVSLQEFAISAMTATLEKATNFKVRINAAFALSVPSTRQAYGNCFATVWEAILNSFKKMDFTDDPIGFQYKSNLSEQLLTTLLHLVDLTEPEELTQRSQSQLYHFFVTTLENILLIFTNALEEVMKLDVSKFNQLRKLHQIEKAITHLMTITSNDKILASHMNKHKDKFQMLFNRKLEPKPICDTKAVTNSMQNKE